MAYWGLGKIDLAIESLDKSLELARASEIPKLIVGVLVDYGRSLRQIGCHEKALQYFAEGFEIAQEIAFDDGVAKLQSELGLSQVINGQQDEGMQNVRAALTKSEQLTDWKLSEAYINSAEAFLYLGEFETAEHHASRGIELGDLLNLREVTSWGYLILGRAQLSQKQFAGAHSSLSKGMEVLDRDGSPLARIWMLAMLAVVANKRGQKDLANTLADGLQDQANRLVNLFPIGLSRKSFTAELNRIANLCGMTISLPSAGQVWVVLAPKDGTQNAALRDDDNVKLLWTVDAGPADELILHNKGKVALRHCRILRLLEEAAQQGADPRQVDLAEALGVTVRTIRADIKSLRKRGFQV